MPKWCEVSLKKTVKVGYPSKNDHPSCAYSLLDYDTDHEFSAGFFKMRYTILEGFRVISSYSPVVPYQYTEAWLKTILASPVDLGPKSKGNLCTTDSPTYLELEAIHQILDAVIAKLRPEQLQAILVPALNLANSCLEFSTVDPVRD